MTPRAFYVYILFDYLGIPRYIGKGRGKRWEEHKSTDGNKLKAAFIRRTLAVLGEIPKLRIREHLDEKTAFTIEIILITALGRIDIGTGCLTNLTDGGDGFNSESAKKANAAWMAASTPEQRSARLKEIWSAPEMRLGQSIRAIAQHADPVKKENHRASLIIANARPEVILHRSDAARLAHARLEVKVNHSAGCKIAQNRPEVRAATSERMKIERADPIKEVARIENLKKTLAQPDVKLRKSEASKEIWRRSELAAKMAANNREILTRPEVLEKIGAGTRGSRWINNGIKNCRLKLGLELPDGWFLGKKKDN